MRGRPVLWAVAAVGLLAGIANRVLLTWIYNRMAVDAAIALNTITDPVLTFVSIVGAVAAAVAIIFAAPQRVTGQTSASGTPGTGPVAARDVDAELLPPLEGAAAPGADSGQFSAVFRVDFTGRWGGTERYRITDSRDVRDVVAWAEVEAQGRAFDVWIEHASRDGVSLVPLLHSHDPR